MEGEYGFNGVHFLFRFNKRYIRIIEQGLIIKVVLRKGRNYCTEVIFVVTFISKIYLFIPKFKNEINNL